MAITFIDEPKRSKITFLDEKPKGTSLYYQQAEERSFVGKVTDKLKGLFRASPAERSAEAANIYAISKITGMGRLDVEANIDELSRDTSITGMPKGTLTNQEYTAMVVAPFIGQAAIAHPLRMAVGIGIYSVLDKVIDLNKFVPSDASNATKTSVELIDMLGKAFLTGGIMKKAPGITNKMTRTKMTEYKLPRKVKLSSEQIKNIWKPTKITTAEELELFKDLGLSKGQLSDAIKQGIDVEIPAEKLTRIIDKPLWAKIKRVVGAKPFQRTIIEKGGKPVVTRGRIGKIDPLKEPIETKVKVDVTKLMKEKLTDVRIAGLAPEVKAALLIEKLKVAKGAKHRASIQKKYGEATTISPYNYQDKNQEVIIHSKWVHNAIRHDFEGAGDIFRELSKETQDFGYISEKIRRLDRLFEGYKEKSLHVDDTVEGAWKNDKENMTKLVDFWKKQPTRTVEQELAKNLNVELLSGNIKKAEVLLSKIKNLDYEEATLKLKAAPQKVEAVKVDRNLEPPKSTADPSIPAASIVKTTSPAVEVEKPLPPSARNVIDYPDSALINKQDASTQRIIESINEGIRKKMARAVEDHGKGKNPYTLNPIVDTSIAFQQLEEKTAFSLYSNYYIGFIKGRNTVAYTVSGMVNKFTDGLAKGYQDSASTERIILWITERKGSLNGEEKLIATKLMTIFNNIKDIVSYLRMRRFIDGVEKVPEAFEDMVMQGEKVFAEGGRDALEGWVKGKDFGVVRDDRYFPSQLLYRFRTHISADPFEVFNPYVQSRAAKEQIYDSSQSLVQKLHSYLTRVYSDYYLYDLLRDISNDLSGTTIPFDTLSGIKKWLVAIQGKGIDVGWWGQTARKFRGQFFKVTLADPTKMVRNYLQRYYMTLQNFPTLQHAIKTKKYFSYKITDAETDYFMKNVSQLGELEREQLYLYEKFFEKGFLGKVDDFAVKIAKLYTKVDQGNRWVTFKYALANTDNYISRYKTGVIDLRGFMSKTGMSSFYPLEQKHILGLSPSEARLEIAKLLVEKTQIRYKKVERGIGALSELGEVATSLIQYPKGIITRYLDGADMIKNGETLQERWDGVRLLVGLVLLASIAQDTLQLITGTSRYYDSDLGREVEHDPYAIVGILGSLGIAGAQPAHAIALARLNKRIVWLGYLESRGELSEKNRMTAIRNILKDVDLLGEAYIPFLRISMNSVESLEGTRAHKLLTTWFDQKTNRQSALRRNKIERDWVGKVTHAIFGRER